MSRIIEIVLFLTPFLTFAAWRLLVPSLLPPAGLVFALAGVVTLMLIALFWLRQLDANDASQAYIPAQLQDGRVIPAHKAAPP